MKKYLLLLSIAFIFYSCKKDNTSNKNIPPKTPVVTENPNLAKLIQVTAHPTDDSFYSVDIVEYIGNTTNVSFHLDTTILRNDFTFQYYPHLNNTIVIAVGISENKPIPVNLGVNYNNSALVILKGTDYSDYEYVKFTAN